MGVLVSVTCAMWVRAGVSHQTITIPRYRQLLFTERDATGPWNTGALLTMYFECSYESLLLTVERFCLLQILRDPSNFGYLIHGPTEKVATNCHISAQAIEYPMIDELPSLYYCRRSYTDVTAWPSTSPAVQVRSIIIVRQCFG